MLKHNLLNFLLLLSFIKLSAQENWWKEFNVDANTNVDEVYGKKIEAHLKELLNCARNQDADCPKGYVFQGPPGTGKTSIAKVVTAKLQATCLYIGGSGFFHSSKDSAVESMSKFFQRAKELARKGKVIQFIDEFDNMALKPVYQQDIDVLNGFIKEISVLDPNIHIIAATHNKQSMEPSLFRENRLKVMLVPLPDETDRLAILKGKLQIHINYDANNHKAIDNMLNKIAKSSNGFDGATLNALAVRAIQYSQGKPVTIEALDNAFLKTNEKHKVYQDYVNGHAIQEMRNHRKEQIELEYLKNLKEKNSWRGFLKQVLIAAIPGLSR
ncbi:hypothetical protein Noda2021_09540 [Candidatus Dependentiae bacterium Noda2021]|nr:hypothetical protein Noda2021_09540 [Candidatus Dependentiae bacterium Noda2021]